MSTRLAYPWRVANGAALPTSASHPLAYPPRQTFCHHHDCRVDVRPHTVWHDRGIDYAQSIEAMHPPMLIDDGHWVRHRPHFAGARDMVACRDVVEHPRFEVGVGAQLRSAGAQ